MPNVLTIQTEWWPNSSDAAAAGRKSNAIGAIRLLNELVGFGAGQNLDHTDESFSGYAVHRSVIQQRGAGRSNSSLRTDHR